MNPLDNIANRVLEHVAKEERGERFHSSLDIHAVHELDYDAATRRINKLTNMELLELIEQVFS